MKKVLFLLFGMILFLSACQTTVRYVNGRYSTKKIVYWPNGEIKLKQPIVENQIHGIAKSYYRNGRILSVVPYFHGIPNGTVLMYDPSGEICLQATYTEGRLNGSVVRYFTNGKPKELIPYQGGKVTGRGFEYFHNGLVHVSTVYSNSVKDGEQIVYNQKGWPKYEVPFARGTQLSFSNTINYRHKRLSPIYSANNEISLFTIEKYKKKWQLAWPVKGGGTITCQFGPRHNPVTGQPQLHTGMDITYGFRQPVLAAADGIVEKAGWAGAYGRAVKVQHDTNFITLYGHLNEIVVKKGEIVKKGQVIGYMGNSGRTTGVHTHFEVRINNIPVDPLLFYRQTDFLLAKEKHIGETDVAMLKVEGHVQ